MLSFGLQHSYLLCTACRVHFICLVSSRDGSYFQFLSVLSGKTRSVTNDSVVTLKNCKLWTHTVLSILKRGFQRLNKEHAPLTSHYKNPF